MKLYPEIILHALKKNKPVGGVRLWFLAKDYDRTGCGYINSRDFRRWLKGLGVSRSTMWRWVDQALELGLLEQSHGVYRLVSWERGALIIGVTHLEKPVRIEIERFINKGWLSWVWAGYLLRFKGKTVSKATLEALTGVPARTQFRHERITGTKKRANYADMGDPEKDPEHAYCPDKDSGGFGYYGRNKKQIPSTYLGTRGIELGNIGRTKKANKRINESLSCGAADDIQERLYCENYEQLKKASRRPQNPLSEWLYLSIGNHAGVGLWASQAA